MAPAAAAAGDPHSRSLCRPKPVYSGLIFWCCAPPPSMELLETLTKPVDFNRPPIIRIRSPPFVRDQLLDRRTRNVSLEHPRLLTEPSHHSRFSRYRPLASMRSQPRPRPMSPQRSISPASTGCASSSKVVGTGLNRRSRRYGADIATGAFVESTRIACGVSGRFEPRHIRGGLFSWHETCQRNWARRAL